MSKRAAESPASKVQHGSGDNVQLELIVGALRCGKSSHTECEAYKLIEKGKGLCDIMLAFSVHFI